MKKTSGTLLYISDIGAESVDIFSYPEGKLVGTLTGFAEPNGLCADAKGNVFVTDADNGRVVKYAHGGTTPIAKLATGGSPIGCAIDPNSGDLAVTFYTTPGYQGNFSIFKNASGSGTNYSGLYRTFFCTYDDSGNLFVDGFAADARVNLGELSKGSSSMAIVKLNWDAGWTGGLQWDGKYLALGDEYASKYVPSRAVNSVYQVKVSNGFATLVKTAGLEGGQDVVQFTLDGKSLIGPDAATTSVKFFPYPKGGKATKTITGFYEPVGSALSR
jgi:hypothetical protein